MALFWKRKLASSGTVARLGQAATVPSARLNIPSYKHWPCLNDIPDRQPPASFSRSRPSLQCPGSPTGVTEKPLWIGKASRSTPSVKSATAGQRATPAAGSSRALVLQPAAAQKLSFACPRQQLVISAPAGSLRPSAIRGQHSNMQRPRVRVAAGLVCLALVGFLGYHQLQSLSFARNQSQDVQRRRLSENSGSECLKEAQCPQKSSCGPTVSANSLPYTVSYSKVPQAEATAFTFKVCSTDCSHSASCKPLERFLLRLDSNLLANTEFFKTVSPAGSISQCSEAAGLGYSWSGSQLGALESHDPTQGEVCQDFSLEIYHESEAFTNLWLTDICQQGVKFVDGSGLLSEPQSTLADAGSCITRMSLEDGTSAIQLVADEDFSRPIEPPVDSELKAEIHRVMAELDGPRRQLLQTTSGAYGYSYSPSPYGYYGSPAASSPPAYGSYAPPTPPLFGRPASPAPPTYSSSPADYGYGYSSYGYGSYGSYGYYGYGAAPKAPASAPSPPSSPPAVTLFGPLSG
ncbi:hypothetical protein WJX74_004973 [Apatococcus lobatus]|uniref:Uncharacterized protein n=1 Tax=Apatococcus lobatus TaxID=904363 RepID=A0AAW1QH63_9CHLO